MSLWAAGRQTRLIWSGRTGIGAILIGFVFFNVVEGVIDHQILGLHQVNETVPRAQWIFWDLGFLAWGAAMVAAGLYLVRRAR